MSTCICPICLREYETNPVTCVCGFEGIRYGSNAEDAATLFSIYKYAKRVLEGTLPYSPSPVQTREYDGRILVDYVPHAVGLSLVDPRASGTEGYTVADDGLLAFKTETLALILNTDSANADFLDESRVRVLFFGKDFAGFEKGFFVPRSPVRFLGVHRENKHFTSDNNVLFNKDMTELVSYAPTRPTEEYRVPPTVRRIRSYAFYFPRHLRRLILPHAVQLDPNALYFGENATVEVARE